ncbi:putative xenobiotic-transporting ATPase [Rosa chinensis]|uniref:Putative xenobiotic-transporting ATPase n=1 Tax=Rosa chinensis TaxID=74649 RepID=A0A2P6R0Z7_ROSCH|nr:putative xenobiotic-transporting ATPase [Rosa chinensis]
MGSTGGFLWYADEIDKLLLLLGTLGSVGDGAMTPITPWSPLTMVILGRWMNDYGSSSPSNETVDKGVMIGSMGIFNATWAFPGWIGSILVIEKEEKGGTVVVASFCIVWKDYPAIDTMKRGKVLGHLKGKVEFKEVHFSYPSRPDTPVLEGLNLTIRAGKTVGFVGAMVLETLPPFHYLKRVCDTVKGKILLDGYDKKRLQLKWFRSQMGLVSQELVLFATSIKENIIFGKEGASMENVTDAAKAANAHDFIVKLSEGYETQVSQSHFSRPKSTK